MSVSVGELPASPVELRGIYYDTLFQGELPYDPHPDESQVGIAGLCRVTRRSGGATHSGDLGEHVGALPGMVDTILSRHDQAARQENGEAVFAFVNDRARQLVTGIVTDIFTQWEVTHDRRERPGRHKRREHDPLLPDAYGPGRWLVIETAAAVMMATTGQPDGYDLRTSKWSAKHLAKVISNWGPEFAGQWFDGTIIEEWIEEQGLSPEERDEWLEICTPARRRRFAARNPADPLRGLKTVKRHVDETLTDENIAACLGCSEEEAAQLFNPGLRLQLAISNSGDPLESVERVKYHLDETLTDDRIARRLGWSKAMAAKTFTPHLRKHFAANHPEDPLAACRSWINGTITMGARQDDIRDRKLAGRL